VSWFDGPGAAAPEIKPTMKKWFGSAYEKVLKDGHEELRFLGQGEKRVHRLEFFFG
jgi:hypothetical protein